MDDAEVLLCVAGQGVMESLEAYSNASLGPEGLHELVLVCEDIGPPLVLTQVLRLAVQEEPRLKGSLLGLSLLRGARRALGWHWTLRRYLQETDEPNQAFLFL